MHRISGPRGLKHQLQSPLLRLPPELRTKIFRYCLVKDGPIDLWPHKWVQSEEPDPTKFAVSTLKVRHQENLEYVRKKMGTGLLGTCRQIYNEAAAFFWAVNHFKFSGRSGWQGLLRFFLTIGPSARARIRRLDVHAPIYMRWPVKDSDGKDMNGRSKNLPKLHMAKIESEGHLDRVALQRVCVILTQDRTLEELNFVIPEGFRNGDEDDFGGYQQDHDMDESEGYRRLEKLKTLDWLKKTVVVESGGYLAVDDGPRQILDKGWDLVCLPGSSIWEKGSTDKGGNTDYEKHEVMQTRTWICPSREWDYLAGMKILFEEEARDSVHANGGKHQGESTRDMPLARVLNGFGGCNFIESDGLMLPVQPTPSAAEIPRWVLRDT